MKRRTLLAAANAAALGLVGTPAWAQAKISGDVRFFCGFPPGGTADLLCRILAEALKPEIGQNVIVESKSGASGFIANETVANAPPDGRTIGLAAMAAMCVAPVMPGQKLPINVDTDLTPIASIVGVYNMLVFGKHVPFRTVPELIEQAKKNPGKISYASAGNGTSQHLAGELFKKMAGVNLLHVPYRGGAPAMQALLGGEVQVSFVDTVTALPYLQSGELRALAVTTPQRAAQAPNVPTIAESGIPGYRASTDFALFAPAGTPDAIVSALSEAAMAAMRSPAVKDRLAPLAIDPVGGSRAEFAGYLAEESAKWRDIIRAKNIRLD
jgi:tripartite-type tricarboxylate transporter receptor subunit TctC